MCTENNENDASPENITKALRSVDKQSGEGKSGTAFIGRILSEVTVANKNDRWRFVWTNPSLNKRWC